MVSREDLVAIVQEWENGTIGERDVQAYAESITDCYEPPELPRNSDDSIPVEVLLYLDSLPAILVTKQDIPAIMTFLKTPAGHAEEGWRRWEEYWNTVDDEERRKALRSHSFYFT